ncbi:hypothetical protein [Myxacorys almedinensis]|uniref:Uncharacterized protein n=1 Tax=Myxacorys almedinensis A TaxID=2690445 RepID=A0A8J7ZB20_9CYAN|nr:hypothetical protein [Myxacorys almedinensis]NDJ18690.1 hypothetical protein [Myxacorys almedinensis A]
MAQASSQWRNLVSLLNAVPLAEVGNVLGKPGLWRRWSAPGGWLLVMGGSIGLLFWNGRLVVATGAGIAMMLLVSVLQDSKGKPWQGLTPLVKGWNQPFAIAAASGGAAMFGTYLATSVWLEAEHHWIATGMIVQGTATLGMVGLLVWQMVGQKHQSAVSSFNQALADLSHEAPLKRLIAVRQLTEHLEQQESRAQQHRTADYLRVMLSREQDAIVRDAILEGLQLLQEMRSLPPSQRQRLEFSQVSHRSNPRKSSSMIRHSSQV